MVTSAGVCWRWRSADGDTDSTKSFVSYYDCLQDVLANGYQAEAPRSRANAAAALRASRTGKPRYAG
jgi:hypothetical protein